MNLGDLRAAVIDRSGGRCEWPTCPDPGAEMAHGKHRGMGGNPSVNTLDNVWWLCNGPGTNQHHDILDGRVISGARREIVALLKAATKGTR